MHLPPYKVIHGFHLPWDVQTMAWATGSGAILASLWTIQPLWLLLLVGVFFDFAVGVAAARRVRTLSLKVAEDRVITNLTILATSKFFYFLSDNAEHFRAVHGTLVQPITDVYPVGDFIAYVLMILILRSIMSHLGILEIRIPWVTEWLDKASAKPPSKFSNENPATRASLLEPLDMPPRDTGNGSAKY